MNAPLLGKNGKRAAVRANLGAEALKELEELYRRREELRSEFRKEHDDVESRIVLMECGIKVGAVLVNEDGEEFHVEKVRIDELHIGAEDEYHLPFIVRGRRIRKNEVLRSSDIRNEGWKAKEVRDDA